MSDRTTETRRRRVGKWIGQLGPTLGLVFVWGLFAALTGYDFIAWGNQRLMLLQTAVVATAAVGATLIIISGGIDLSVGSSIALGTMIVAFLLEHRFAPWLAALTTIVCGAAIGVVVGSLVIGHVGRMIALLCGGLAIGFCWSSRLTPVGAVIVGVLLSAILFWLNEKLHKRVELSPFIVTLGMWGALRGIAKGIGNNQPIYPDQTWLTDLMQPARGGLFAILAPGVWLMLLLAVAAGLVLRYTRFGRYVFAIGSNEQTARLCGIHVGRTKLAIYAFGLSCAALAAILQFAFLYGQGDPTTAEGYELKVIAAVVIGGASLSGGEGSILGTVVGALIMTVVDNGCTKLGLENWVQEIVTGGIIIGAVTIDQLRHRREWY